MLQYLWLLPMGAVAGTYGTIIGAGGGILLVPLLLLAYPQDAPEVATSISLVVVFFNGLSGSIAYARMRRIDYRFALLFSASVVPGSILGALSTGLSPRRIFEIALGLLLIAVATFLALRTGRASAGGQPSAKTPTSQSTTAHRSFNPAVGAAVGLAVGYLAALMGIGGGVIQVPVMIHMLGFPVHIATATSVFVLLINSLTASITHAVAGSFTVAPERILFLAIGTVAGAQLGARLSLRMRDERIIRLLALGLAAVGVRLLFSAA